MEMELPLVDNSVINALLEAIFDVLDLDGQKSIIRAAGLEEVISSKLPEGKSSFSILHALLKAMHLLLQHSVKILNEIGKKFSFYLDPQGSALKEFLIRINNALGYEYLILREEHPQEWIVCMRSLSQNPSLMKDKWMMEFFKGVFEGAIMKRVGGSLKVYTKINASNETEYHITVSS